MEANLDTAITRLATGHVLRIEDAEGQCIAVVNGMVWVTQEGDRRDIFLSDGDTFTLDRPGTALVEAIGDTRLLMLVGDAVERPHRQYNLFDIGLAMRLHEH